MSNALKVYEASSFLALSNDGGDIAEAMASVSEVGEKFGVGDLTRVKVPSQGGKHWTIETVAGDEVTQEITGVLCYIQKRGVLWPNDDPEEGAQPVLVSYDLEIGEQIGPIPDHMLDALEKCRIGEKTFDWQKLPYNEFGTGKNGHGKKAREQRLLFILREGDLYPLCVTAPPGSLKTVRKFILGLPQAIKLPFWHAVVTLGLEQAKSASGQTYSRIVPRLSGVLSREDGAIIKTQYYDTLSRIATQVEVDETEDGGE